MAYDFDVSSPADNDYISDFPANERAARTAKKEAFEVDHELAEAFHDKVTLNEQAADQDPAASKMAIYCKDSDGQPELFVQEEDDGAPGDVIHVTKGGFLHQVISTLLAAPAEERTMLGNLLLANHLQISVNAKRIDGRNNADDDYYEMLQLDADDELIVGESGAGTIQKLLLKLASNAAGTPAENFLVEYGDGEKKIWHEGNDGAGSGLDADKLDGGDMAARAPAANGYQTFPNGFKLIWGVQTVAANSDGIYALPSSFVSWHLACVANYRMPGGYDRAACGAYAQSTTQIRIVSGSDYTEIVSYFCVGY